MNLTGPLEARLLALERLQARAEGDLRGLRLGLIGLNQGVWDAWSDVRAMMPVATPIVTHPATVTGCGTVQLPDTLPLVDSEMGSCTLTFDGVSAWVGCNPAATRPGPIVFALHYKYTNAGALTCSYAGNGGTLIPTAGTTCGTTTNINNIAYSGAGVVCSPFQQTFHNGGSLAMNTLYATSGNTFTVTVG